MKYHISLLIVFLTLSFYGYSQNAIEVTGKVTDGDGEDLPGATVMVKGSKSTVPIATITDFEGNYRLIVPQDAILVYTFIGFQIKEIPVNNQSIINVQLISETTELDQVVVVGYGTQTKASAVGSIATAKGEDLLKVGSVNSVSEAIQGQMTGVVAINTSSKPGEDNADLLIRGQATWQNASPLVLVDGVERDFNDVDVQEIESFSVLKDASATAVYGVKGANGVILITTKRGEEGQAKISLTANFGWKKPTAEADWADYPLSMRMYNEAQANDQNWGNQIPDSEILAWDRAYATGNYGPYNDVFPEINWWDEIVETGHQQTYNLNISGGTEKFKYFSSIGYLNDGDIYSTFEKDEYTSEYNYKRYNWRSNFDFSLTKTTTLSANIAGKMGYTKQPFYRGGDTWFFSFFYNNSNNEHPIKYSDGEWGADATGEGNLMIALQETGIRRKKTYQGFYDVILKQKLDFITKGLSATASLSYTTNSTWNSELTRGKILNNGNDLESMNSIVRYYRQYDYANPILDVDGNIIGYPMFDQQRFKDETTTDDYPLGGSYDNFGNYGRKLYYELKLDYNRTFNNHKVTGLLVFNRKRNELDDGPGGKDSFVALAFPDKEESYVGRATYSYKEKYLLEINGAYEGTSKFAAGKQFGLFNSYSLGWRASEEPFVKNIFGDKLSNLKFRASYGEVGNDKVNPYQGASYIFTGKNATFGLDQKYNWGPLIKEESIGDTNRTWERATKRNIAMDLGLWHKLTMSVDFFDENRTHILMTPKSAPAWISSAVKIEDANIGEAKNHGMEFDVAWNDKINDFRYHIKYGFATSESRITFKDDPKDYADYLKDEGKSIGYQTKYLATGNYLSMDDIYNGASSGIANADQNTLVPGDLYYIDFNGDGRIDEFDKVPVKEMNKPLTTMSLNLGGSWKNFGFNVLFYAVFDVYKDYQGSYLWDFPGGNKKAQPNTLERWTPETPWQSGPIRPSVHINNAYNSLGSTYVYVKHDYVRLKNAELNYTLPKKLAEKLSLSKCQFYVNGNNLITISDVDSRKDPETKSQDVFPIVKRYNAGVRVNF